MSTPMVTNFTAGMLSPLLDGRVDLTKYANGARYLENVIVYPYGSVTRRPGTQYIASAACSANGIMLVPFKFSASQAYIVEFGQDNYSAEIPGYLRFFYDGALLNGTGRKEYVKDGFLKYGLDYLTLSTSSLLPVIPWEYKDHAIYGKRLKRNLVNVPGTGKVNINSWNTTTTKEYCLSFNLSSYISGGIVAGIYEAPGLPWTWGSKAKVLNKNFIRKTTYAQTKFESFVHFTPSEYVCELAFKTFIEGTLSLVLTSPAEITKKLWELAKVGTLNYLSKPERILAAAATTTVLGLSKDNVVTYKFSFDFIDFVADAGSGIKIFLDDVLVSELQYGSTSPPSPFVRDIIFFSPNDIGKLKFVAHTSTTIKISNVSLRWVMAPSVVTHETVQDGGLKGGLSKWTLEGGYARKEIATISVADGQKAIKDGKIEYKFEFSPADTSGILALSASTMSNFSLKRIGLRESVHVNYEHLRNGAFLTGTQYWSFDGQAAEYRIIATSSEKGQSLTTFQWRPTDPKSILIFTASSFSKFNLCCISLKEVGSLKTELCPNGAFRTGTSKWELSGESRSKELPWSFLQKYGFLHHKDVGSESFAKFRLQDINPNINKLYAFNARFANLTGGSAKIYLVYDPSVLQYDSINQYIYKTDISASAILKTQIYDPVPSPESSSYALQIDTKDFSQGMIVASLKYAPIEPWTWNKKIDGPVKVKSHSTASAFTIAGGFITPGETVQTLYSLIVEADNFISGTIGFYLGKNTSSIKVIKDKIPSSKSKFSINFDWIPTVSEETLVMTLSTMCQITLKKISLVDQPTGHEYIRSPVFSESTKGWTFTGATNRPCHIATILPASSGNKTFPFGSFMYKTPKELEFSISTLSIVKIKSIALFKAYKESLTRDIVLNGNFATGYTEWTLSTKGAPVKKIISEVSTAGHILATFSWSMNGINPAVSFETSINLVCDIHRVSLRDYADPMIINSPYKYEDLKDIRWAQQADVMYVVHPKYPPHKLCRYAHNHWVLEEAVILDRPRTWSKGLGYPKTVSFFEQRLWYGGTDSSPQSIWASELGFYDYFTTSGATFTRALQFIIGSSDTVDRIQWMSAQKHLIIGTEGSEWSISAPSGLDGLSSTNIKLARESGYGSIGPKAELIGNQIVFAGRMGRSLKAFNYSMDSDGYIASNLSLLNDSIIGSGIKQFAYQQEPSSVIWVLTNDNQLVSCTFYPAEQVLAWTKHTTYGKVDSIAIIPGKLGNDELWISTTRDITESTDYALGDKTVSKKYIEKMCLLNTENNGIENSWYVDCGYKYSSPSVDISNFTPTHYSFTQVDIPAVKVTTKTSHNLTTANRCFFANLSSGLILNNNTYKILSIVDNLNFVIDANLDTPCFLIKGVVRKKIDSLSNLYWLKGNSVDILGDGSPISNKIVDYNGKLAFGKYCKDIVVGKPYSSTIVSQRLEQRRRDGGVSQGHKKRMSKCVIRFYNTVGAMCGISTSTHDLVPIPFRTTTDKTDVAVPMFSGDKEITVPNGFNTDGIVAIIQEQPLPLTVLGIIQDIDVKDI